MIPLCNKYGIKYIEHENRPLGRKKNAGLNAAMKLEWDYLIELGSDDIILDTIFDAYKPFMKRGEDFFGSNKMLFIDSIMGHTRFYQADEANYGWGWGLGRAMSRKMVESMGGKIKIKALTGLISWGEIIPEGEISWVPKEIGKNLRDRGMAEILDGDGYYLWTDNIDRMLDNDASSRLAGKGFKYKVVETKEPFLADFKSDENIWGYNPEIGEPYDLEKFLSKLSQKEKAMFFANQKKLRNQRIEKGVMA